jgi:pimeloyl-ACP methyl ester carboxylesterase
MAHATRYVIVPGIGMSHRYSRRLHSRLARVSPVRSLDLPGFAGRTPRPRPMTVEHQAEWIEEALDADRAGPSVLIGHSMGAQFSVEVARRRPDLVDRLVLAAPVVDPRRRSALVQSAELLLDFTREPLPGSATVAADFFRTSPVRFAAALRSMLRYRLEDALTEVEHPVLVVRGERDPVVGRAWCAQLAAAAPDGRHVELPRAAHLLQHSRSAELAALITEFSGASAPPRASAPLQEAS